MNKIVGIGMMVVGLGAMVYGMKKLDDINKQEQERLDQAIREMNKTTKDVKETLRRHAAFEEKVSEMAK